MIKLIGSHTGALCPVQVLVQVQSYLLSGALCPVQVQLFKCKATYLLSQKCPVVDMQL